MPKPKSTTKQLTVKELTAIIKSHRREICPSLPKTKAGLQTVSRQLNLPTTKPRVRKPRTRKS